MKHPEVPGGLPVALLRRIQALIAGAAIDHGAPIDGETALSDTLSVESLARYVWHGNEEATHEFMSTPHTMLGGRSPRDTLAAGEGQRVAAVLLRLLFGMAS